MLTVRLCILFSLIFYVQFAHAIVNAEDLKPGIPKQGLSSTIDVSAAGANGNSDYRQVSGGLRVQYVKGDGTSFVVGNYTYGESQGSTNADKAFLHGRHIRRLTDITAGEIFIQTQYNDFSRLSSRNLIGGGARITLLNESKRSIDLGIGAFYEHEKLLASATDPGASENNWRLNTYIVAKYAINSYLRLASTTYYQPVADQFGDYRILEDFSLLTRAGDNLEFKLSINIAHDNKPPADVKMTDSTYTAGFVYQLGR